MIHLDFLPARYAQQRRKQRMRLWQGSLVAVFGAIVVAAAAYQSSLNKHVRLELDRLTPMHQSAQAKKQAHAHLQRRLAQTQATARLFAVAGLHRPVTQIVAPLIEKAPEQLVFRQVSVAFERRGIAPESLTDSAEDLDQTQRELARLQLDRQRRQLVVRIRGRALDAAGLQQFAAQLRTLPVYEQVELDSLQAISLENSSVAMTEFSLRIVVRQPQLGIVAPAQAASEGGPLR